MAIERNRKFFGFKSNHRKLMSGEQVYEISQGHGFFSGKLEICKFQVITQDIIRMQMSTAVYGNFGFTYHEILKPIEKLLFREEINEANICGTTFLGAKERIIWRSNK